MQTAPVRQNEPAKLLVRYGTACAGSKNIKFDFFLLKEKEGVPKIRPEEISSGMPNFGEEIKGIRIMKMPDCFGWLATAFAGTDAFNGHIGYIYYKFEGNSAVPYDHRAKLHAREVPRLGYYLEAIAIHILEREYQITGMKHDTAVSDDRKRQLGKVGLQTTETKETGVREWLLGLGKGIRKAVKEYEENRERGFRPNSKSD